MARRAPRADDHIIASMDCLKTWVTSKDDVQNKYLQDGIVVVNVTHNFLRKEMKEIRLELHATISAVKEKLYRHCGTLPNHMALVLKSEGRVVCELKDDSRPLGFYSVTSGMEIKIVDQNPHSLAKDGGLEDVSLVEKYVMTESEYDSRTNTLRNFRKEQLKLDPKFKFFPKKGGAASKTVEALPPGTTEDVKEMKLEDRCEINPGSRRGKLGFIGEVDFAPGYWLGVILDEPLGKNDGTVRGKRYMTCTERHGVFVHPKRLSVGDFPEIDELDCTSSDDEL